ncbi:MAG: transporter substrate-binding domain-containing protein [Xanthobacteraceae bacterium]|nr:transporter substrate-binding domain-containing protein [Xanthobacteraceae bacterium]MBX3535971.1 transporter substrate-binding domain-containing protein [Xanthobacteraceae bacterium]MBX3549212.1 transporter substrate-binding domain-containing protein [Xanthobacteraceae bacterium]MCW5673646.1 transporter substrate-binding domain-containing protein [Xanthobacteraceae bacterium]MCW5678384.1 transporter substrate-binding domain-containing protein [Xanthobacteraceae bacterium]
MMSNPRRLLCFGDRRLRNAFICMLAAVLMFSVSGAALPPSHANAQEIYVPRFWDPKRRPEKPNLGRMTQIRFMTEDDFPPFHFRGPNGLPIGFNIDLARAICEELALACTVQVRRFDTLLPALDQGAGDAVIASIAITPETRAKADFTDRYYRTPARFAAKKDSPLKDISPELIAGKSVAVVAGSAHEAYLRTFFAETAIKSLPDMAAVLSAVKSGEADLAFADGIALAVWLNGADSANCCAFRGGPFTESRYFGEGVGIAVRKGNDTLVRALNYALYRLWERGVFTDLYLRYFPVGFY